MNTIPKAPLPIIKAMKEHFNARAVEWGMAGWAISTGLMFLFVPMAFRDGWPFNADILGFLFLLMGGLRGSALLINGMWKRTPLVRLFTSALSAFMITWLITGILEGPPTLGIVNFFWLFFADCLSAKRATEDWLESRKRELFYDESVGTT